MTPTTPTSTQPPTPEQVLLLLADCIELGNTPLPDDRCGRLDLIAAHDKAEDALAALDPAHLRTLAQAQAEQQKRLERITKNRDQIAADNETLSTWNAKLEAELRGARVQAEQLERVQGLLGQLVIPIADTSKSKICRVCGVMAQHDIEHKPTCPVPDIQDALTPTKEASHAD